ncbi:MAG: regulatory protein TetR, partial [Deltaproteobacteria bacterium]|nr:regulatory protein TetR [Deltaproteobacteria bacterium]
EQAGSLVVQTVESLTHRFAAHPEEQIITQTGFVNEVVTMLEAYLTCRGG